MSVSAAHILGILADNLRKRKGVVRLSKSRATDWARGLDIPMGGETVIYTGHMYQLMPSISAMEKKMRRFEESWVSRLFGVGRILNKVIDISSFLAWADRSETRAYNDILRDIAHLLRTAKIEFGYLYDHELYSGALLYDEGIDDVFRIHALRVHELFKKHGVKRIITVDPHTTNMLRSVYPGIIEGFDLEVKSYLEVLAEGNMTPTKNLGLETVIHDSCVYARYEEVIEEPRRLLNGAGVEIKESEFSGRLTHCCGGPVESLYPSKARAIADNRIEQLAKNGVNIVAMCPICVLNLKKAAEGRNVEVHDISKYLVEAYGGT
jgi:Fe-S oxidoreductase